MPKWVKECEKMAALDLACNTSLLKTRDYGLKVKPSVLKCATGATRDYGRCTPYHYVVPVF